jgi:hypothetical protein
MTIDSNTENGVYYKVHHYGSLLRRFIAIALYLQSVTIIQPGDTLCDGSFNMCDGCPDITVWKDQLAWSCRLEEQMKFGCFVRAVPKQGVRGRPHELLRNS